MEIRKESSYEEYTHDPLYCRSSGLLRFSYSPLPQHREYSRYCFALPEYSDFGCRCFLSLEGCKPSAQLDFQQGSSSCCKSYRFLLKNRARINGSCFSCMTIGRTYMYARFFILRQVDPCLHNLRKYNRSRPHKSPCTSHFLQ